MTRSRRRFDPGDMTQAYKCVIDQGFAIPLSEALELQRSKAARRAESFSPAGSGSGVARY